ARQTVQRVARAGGLGRELFVQLLHRAFDDSLEQSLFSIIVVIQRPTRYACPRNEFLGADFGKAARPEQVASNALELGLGSRRLLFLRHIHTVCILSARKGQAMNAALAPVKSDAKLASPAIHERFVTLPKLGLSTRVLRTGAGPVAVLLHGTPDNADEWGAVMHRLGATHRCIAPDIPGYGKSPEPPKSFDYSRAAQIAFVDELLAVLGISERVLLIVHDIGGVMGIAWAGAHPQRLTGLLITNTVAFQDFKWFPIARTWGNPSWLGRLRARAGMAVISVAGGHPFKNL